LSSTFKGDGIISYTRDAYQATIRGNYEKNTDKSIWGFSLFHNVSKWYKYAIDFDADQQWDRGPIVAVVGEYKVDDSSTLKGKWSYKLTDQSKQPEMRIGLSILQKVSPYFNVTASTDLNLRNLLGESIGDAHTFGLELKMQDF